MGCTSSKSGQTDLLKVSYLVDMDSCLIWRTISPPDKWTQNTGNRHRKWLQSTCFLKGAVILNSHFDFVSTKPNTITADITQGNKTFHKFANIDENQYCYKKVLTKVLNDSAFKIQNKSLIKCHCGNQSKVYQPLSYQKQQKLYKALTIIALQIQRKNSTLCFIASLKHDFRIILFHKANYKFTKLQMKSTYQLSVMPFLPRRTLSVAITTINKNIRWISVHLR